MNAELLKTSELFIRNRNLVRDTFKWEGEALHTIGGALLTAAGLEPGVEALKEAERTIKANTSVLSPLRGTIKMVVLSCMLMRDNQAEYISNIERAYNLIRITRRNRNERFYLAAIALANVVSDKEELLGLVDAANDIYAVMKESHGNFADGTGYATAAVMAAGKITDPESIFEEAEKCCGILEETWGRSADIEALSLVLATDNASADFKCARFREIFRGLEEGGVRFKGTDEMPVLGCLSLLNMTNSEIARNLSEADAYLREQKGFGIMSCRADRRHMYAALLVEATYSATALAFGIATSIVLEDAFRARFAA